MSSQGNTESIDKEAGPDSVNKLYVVYNAYIRDKIEELPRRVSLARFREIYRGLWKKDSKTCENIYNVLINTVEKTSLEEIEEFNESFGLKDKFKILNETCADYSNSNDSKWRPNGNVDDTLKSHDMEVMLKRKMLLEKLVEDQIKENEQTKCQIDKHVVKIRACAEKIEKAIEDHERRICEQTKIQEILSSNLEKL